MPQLANEYTDSITFTSTGADVGFGFLSDRLRLRNDSIKSIYFTLRATTGATTSGAELKSSEELNLDGFGTGGLSFVATSSGGSLRVVAWAN